MNKTYVSPNIYILVDNPDLEQVFVERLAEEAVREVELKEIPVIQRLEESGGCGR